MKPFLAPVAILSVCFALVGCSTTGSVDQSQIEARAKIENRNEAPARTAAIGALDSKDGGLSKDPTTSRENTAAKPVTVVTEASPPRTSTTKPAPSSNGASGPIAGAATPPQSSSSTLTVSQSTPPALEAVDLWDRMRAGFKMPEMNTALVAEKEKFYLSKPEYLQRMFDRGNRYLFFIMEEIDKRGMPMELALLPFVESAMNPVAMSHAKASGLWQFIPSTGKQYNLSQNWWVDNRRDVAKATVAALEYLDRIYKMQGNDWFLALASYNWGEGSVGRAMRANAARGLPTDYLSLSMPAETRHYVPKLIALRNIVMRSKELGVVLPAAPNQPYFVSVEKTRPIDLKLAAQFAGMTVPEFVALNPAHNRPVIAASKNNQLLIPAARHAIFMSAIEKHADSNKVFATWQPRTINSGETLETIAATSGVSVAELLSANGLRTQQRLLPGSRLLVPNNKVKDETAVESFVAPRLVEAVNVPAQRHVVKKKESINSIAARYGVSVAALKAWNGIKQGVNKGMNLIVRPAYAQTVVTHETGSRQVVSSNQVKLMAVSTQAAQVEEAPQTKAASPTVGAKATNTSKAAVKSTKTAKPSNIAKGAKGDKAKKTSSATKQGSKATVKAASNKGQKQAAKANGSKKRDRT